MEIDPVSPFVSAEAYRIGQQDGFKVGVIAGVAAVLVIKAVRSSRKKRPKNEKPFAFNW